MNTSSYPIYIRNAIKTGPVVAMIMFGLTGMYCLMLDNVARGNQHHEKFFFKSNKFEQSLRRRDLKLRTQYKKIIDAQPTEGILYETNRWQ